MRYESTDVRLLSGSHWLKTFGLTVAAILLVSMLIPLLSSERIIALTDHFFPTLSRVRPWPDHHQLGFATHDGKTLTLQLTTYGPAPLAIRQS